MHVIVAVSQQRAPDRVVQSRLSAIEVPGEDQVKGPPGLLFVLVVPARVVPAAGARDLLRSQAERERVLLAGLLGDLDRGAVARADGKCAVHHGLDFRMSPSDEVADFRDAETG
jgi:hypothetical protein